MKTKHQTKGTKLVLQQNFENQSLKGHRLQEFFRSMNLQSASPEMEGNYYHLSSLLFDHIHYPFYHQMSYFDLLEKSLILQFSPPGSLLVPSLHDADPESVCLQKRHSRFI